MAEKTVQLGNAEKTIDIVIKNPNAKILLQKLIMNGSYGTSLPSSGQEGEIFILIPEE